MKETHDLLTVLMLVMSIHNINAIHNRNTIEKYPIRVSAHTVISCTFRQPNAASSLPSKVLLGSQSC